MLIVQYNWFRKVFGIWEKEHSTLLMVLVSEWKYKHVNCSVISFQLWFSFLFLMVLVSEGKYMHVSCIVISFQIWFSFFFLVGVCIIKYFSVSFRWYCSRRCCWCCCWNSSLSYRYNKNSASGRLFFLKGSIMFILFFYFILSIALLIMNA